MGEASRATVRFEIAALRWLKASVAGYFARKWMRGIGWSDDQIAGIIASERPVLRINRIGGA